MKYNIYKNILSHLENIKILQARFAKLDLQYTTLIQIEIHPKRGLINAFGTGIKSLFGTIKADAAEKIRSSIDKAYQSNNNLAQL